MVPMNGTGGTGRQARVPMGVPFETKTVFRHARLTCHRHPAVKNLSEMGRKAVSNALFHVEQGSLDFASCYLRSCRPSEQEAVCDAFVACVEATYADWHA